MQVTGQHESGALGEVQSYAGLCEQLLLLERGPRTCGSRCLYLTR